jgi:hypothetical protein
MKKTNELNLTVGTDLGVSPYLKKRQIHNGGMTNSADNVYGGTYMSRVNKGYDKLDDDNEEDIEDEELDNLLREFGLDTLSKWGSKALNLGKSAAFSIPGIGDAAAGASFLWMYYGPWGMRSQVKGFTRKLSSLSGVDLGNDFLEAEGKISQDTHLDARINEAVYRLTNLNEFEELKVTYLDIVTLEKEFDDINDKIRDLVISFVGFADALTFQQGIYLNIALSVLDPEDIPAFIVGRYADYVRKIEASGQKNKIYGAASKALATAGKPLDYLGNLDLLFNIDKLNRLGKINLIFKEYKDVDTDRKKKEKGLTPEPGTSFARKLATGAGLEAPKDEEEEKLFHKIFKKALGALTENNTSLSELYIDEDDTEENDDGIWTDGPISSESDMDEVSPIDAELSEFSGAGAGGGGGTVPLGKMHRKGTPNYSQEDIRKFHSYAHKTYGKTK